MLLLLLQTADPAHLAGTLLPRGFFLGLGLIYLSALMLDRLAERLRLPAAVAILLLGLAIPSNVLPQAQPLGSLQLETIHRVSLALLIFYAGLKTDLRRIQGVRRACLGLGTVGVLITLVLTGLVMIPVAAAVQPALPLSALLLTVCCLAATDSGALEDLLAALRHRVPERLEHVLQVEAALSTVMALLVFGFLSGILQVQPHQGHQLLHAAMAGGWMQQSGAVALHVIAGMVAGLVVGGLAPRLIDGLVRSEQQLLLVAVALAFVAYGFGQILGGGGLVAVFVAGVFLSNGHYQINRFERQALGHVMHPFNTAAEITVLLLLGILVQPVELIPVLPLALPLALVLPLARLAGVWLVLPATIFSQHDRLTVAGCGLRSAVPLALAVSLADELPNLRGVAAEAAESLGSGLLAMLFVVVVVDLCAQTVLMRRLLPAPAV